MVLWTITAVFRLIHRVNWARPQTHNWWGQHGQARSVKLSRSLIYSLGQSSLIHALKEVSAKTNAYAHMVRKGLNWWPNYEFVFLQVSLHLSCIVLSLYWSDGVFFKNTFLQYYNTIQYNTSTTIDYLWWHGPNADGLNFTTQYEYDLFSYIQYPCVTDVHGCNFVILTLSLSRFAIKLSLETVDQITTCKNNPDVLSLNLINPFNVIW